ncbi:vitamin K epoxide reductase family protein [Leifsonia sp. PS1209]|uniref:vitamin K epoxide reductase family protein n=1 Tax=Leifsonia sp. PS1209 TaxID=2724914 RepID=UPI0024929A6F|nr:vitamin K epoxide reductase family protein [Leifsonia sp. PS1209]
MSKQSHTYGGALFVVLGLVGLAASFALVLEKLKHLESPTAQLTCSVNPFITCAPAMDSWQGTLLGFPNPLIGVVCFVAPIVVGVSLVSGARFPRWFVLAFVVGVCLGMGFIVWLMVQTVSSIGALCPYCLVVWAVMIPLTLATAAWAASSGTLGGAAVRSVGGAVLRVWLWPIALLCYSVVFLVLLANFPLLWPFLTSL